MTASGATATHHDTDHDGHDGHDGHDSHDSHDDGHGPAENPSWVLVPLAIGLVIGLILAIVFGFGSSVSALG